MGDAVMAFFGGKNINTFNAIIDGINCSSVINAFYQTIIIPKLGYEDTTNEGIRIGLDYGSKDSVHWSSYGYPGANEVTATGFNIDVASKLQNSAGKNNIMIGQKLKEHIDFPDELLSIKKVKRDGQEIEEPYIKPNYTDVKGNSINYKKYLLNWKDFLFTTNIGQLERTKLTDKNISPIRVSAELYESFNGIKICDYQPSSNVNPKSKWLKFTARIPCIPQLPATIEFKVENHGIEASKQSNFGNHYKAYNINSEKNMYTHWETLSYHGFHYMIVTVKNQRGIQFQTNFGVFIE